MVSSTSSSTTQAFSLAQIKAATNNFHEGLVIDEGGFGKVYKGYICSNTDDGGNMVAAIKRRSQESLQGSVEFKTEIQMLSHLRHDRLVSLFGYCDEDNEMILVYEYMSNGSLRDHLHHDTAGKKYDPLPWKRRLEICIGAAIGLNYLHTGLKHTIVHRDIKTSNILLDEKWDAKISDLGISKMDPTVDNLLDQRCDARGSDFELPKLHRKPTKFSTRVMGTIGYAAPEYLCTGQLTEKSDVYSFGVVLLEVLCGKSPCDRNRKKLEVYLVKWALKCMDNGTFYQIIDPYLMRKISPECFKTFVQIIESCLQRQGIKRPAMNDVVESLVFALELQERADADQMERNKPGGGGGCDEHIYPEIIFPVPRHSPPKWRRLYRRCVIVSIKARQRLYQKQKV